MPNPILALPLIFALQQAPDAMPVQVEQAIEAGATMLLLTQEGSNDAEWPYEGVYRVRAQKDDPSELIQRRSAIPIGYRVGGTGICAEALFQAPGYEQDPERQKAVAKAVAFVCSAIKDPRMSAEDYEGGYDVRGWGYIYGMRMLLALRAADIVPEGMDDTVDATIRWYIAGLNTIEIPRVGGWNYARRGSVKQPSATSPFMTAPAVMALFDAKRQGFTVDDAVIERALDALELCLAPDGYVAYSAQRQTADDASQIPGATGRMVASEAALMLAGRSDETRLRRAVDAFFEHWDALEVRRQKTGTHVPPYGVAPYYFFFAHAYAADAIELLPEEDRASRRKQLREIFWRIRDDDGSWNDRVFPRSRSYGTAMTMHALQRPWLETPARWEAPPAPKKPTEESKPGADS